ncbi:MAG: hypothetical protein ACRC6M_13045 [Microcystaceae cyanobacterium]
MGSTGLKCYYGFRYHDHWLRNLLIASFLNGRRSLLSARHKLLRN